MASLAKNGQKINVHFSKVPWDFAQWALEKTRC